MNVSGFQIAQSRPGNTSAATLFTASEVLTEVMAIFIANTTSSAATFRLFHDNDGTTYSADTALYYDVSIPANSTFELSSGTNGAGISVRPGGSIGIRSGTADALNFTLYGQPQDIARAR